MSVTTRARLVVILALLGLTFVAYEMLDWGYLRPRQDLDTQVIGLQDQLQMLIQRNDEVARALAANHSDTGTVQLVARGDVQALGGALQQQTRSAITEAGGVPSSSQSTVLDVGKGLTKISVLLRARFDEKGLLSFLRSSESRKPLILVEALEIHPQPIAGDPHPLDVTATLSELHTDAP